MRREFKAHESLVGLVLAGVSLSLLGACPLQEGADCEVAGDGDGAGNGPPTPSAQAAEDAAVSAVRSAGVAESLLLFEDSMEVGFFGCARIGDSDDVVCALDITPQSSELTVYFAQCEVVGGNYYSVQSALFTDNTSNDYGATAAVIEGGASCKRRLVQGVTARARLRIEAVDPAAERFALIEFPIHVMDEEGPKLFVAEGLSFRDVSID